MPQTSQSVSEDTAVVTKPALGLFEFVTLMATMTSLVALSIDAMLLKHLYKSATRLM